MIKLHQVNSSTVEAIGCDPDSHVLRIAFKNRDGGSTPYDYFEVPANVAWKLLDADSVGKFVGEHIKGPNWRTAPIYKCIKFVVVPDEDGAVV